MPGAPLLRRTWPCCTDQGWRRNDPDPVLGSYDADGLRASQLQHAVQDLDRDVHLSRPTLVRTQAQPVPDHALEPANGGLAARARFVYPDAVCQAILPFSAISSRWRSRCVEAVSAVALGTAVERGGTMTAAAGWRSATLA